MKTPLEVICEPISPAVAPAQIAWLAAQVLADQLGGEWVEHLSEANEILDAVWPVAYRAIRDAP